MNILIHDLKPSESKRLFPEWTEERGWMVFSDDGSIRNCIGCFGCWVRTPGACVIRDRYGDMGKCLGRCENLVLVSRCAYGSLSPFVKMVVDRSISYLHPDFVIKDGEMHHKRRYDNQMKLHALFYGDTTEGERGTAKRLIKAMSVNLSCEVSRVDFKAAAAEWEGASV
ncbi:MAG: flavodoxin family protein [Clostridia bacterium]|nr:flavodoxin family protein [Clostridia bacterium]